MLTSELTRKIEDFVYLKPRSIQEVAQHLGKNWRTVDRYIEEIQKNFGTLSTRVFREGTRGALKIVFWSSIEKISCSVFQEKLEQDILRAKRKEEFSAFDIFQHVGSKHKRLEICEKEEDNLDKFSALMSGASKQVIFFSGNLSFINFGNKKINFIKIIEGLVKRNVSIKVLCRVDLAGKENVEKILSLNFKHKKELIEVRHDENPLRAMIIDNQIIRLKEVKEPTGRTRELNKKLFIFYTLNDKEWAEWLSRIFWKKFNNSIGASKRLEELDKIILNQY